MTGAFLALMLLAAPQARPAAKGTPAPAPAPLPASVDGLPIGALPRQQLPATGCAAYLWSTGPSQALVAMVTADPAQLRLSIGGTITDFARTSAGPGGALGLSSTATYAAGEAKATLEMAVETRADLKDGGSVRSGVLSVDLPGQDGFVLPVAGLVGCAPGPN